MKRLIRRLFHRHLSTKLISMLLFLLLLSITVISSFYYWSSTQMIANHVRASTKQSAMQSADYLSIILTASTDMGQQIFRDTRIQQVIQTEARGKLSVDQKFDHKQAVNDILNNMMYTSSFVRSIYLLRDQGSSWGSGLFNASKVMRYTLGEQDWYRSVVSNQVDERWLPLQYDPFSGGGENTELVLTYVKPLRNFETREAVGAIVVNVDGPLLLQAINRIKLGRTGRFFIVDGEGQMMISEIPEEWSTSMENTALGKELRAVKAVETEFEIEQNGNQYYVVARKMNNGWSIVGMVPIEEVIGDIKRVQRQIWLFGSLFLLAASLIGYGFSKRITSPLKQLMKQMEEIGKSNFSALSHVTSQDEIGLLSRRFNRMVRQIEYLLKQVNRVEAKKREAEMRALRHQINPHFLYNTLTSIRYLIRFGQSNEAYEGISSLVQLMEASMEKKGVFCKIGDELALLEKYMVIQQFRYGTGIQLSIQCPDHLREVEVPRMLLQPVVENAVFHGLAPKQEGGEITVSVLSEEISVRPHKLTMLVEDNGLGIAAEKLPGLLKRSREAKSGLFGIGLNHVHETVQLYYGEESGVWIESKEGIGTIVRIELMMKAGETDEL